MPVRRSTDPICLQHVWDSIRSTHHQRQVADYGRIVKYMQRVGKCTLQQAELYLNQSLEDDLVVAKQKTAYKGPKLGMQVESYKIPSELDRPKMDGKDWYCIECHLAGDVTPCQVCHRVFHVECASMAKQRPNLFKTYHDTNQSVVANNQVELIRSEPELDKSEPLLNEAALKESDAAVSNEIIADDALNRSDASLNATDAPAIDQPPESNETATVSNDSVTLPSQNSTTANETIEMVQSDESKTEAINRIALDEVYNEKLCSLCNMSRNDTNLGLDKEELNHLLSFILERIRSWLPDDIKKKMAPEARYEWLTDQELMWRANQLFYMHIDMTKMDEKLKRLQYATVYDFVKDVVTVQHNVAIFHGTESQEYAASELMLNDCIHDINELINCVDCYKHSNEKINSNWFCLPCRRPHKLVWAKQKGYPYWPAKVIKETDTSYDVRFFGGKYERSVLPKNCIKPITVSKDTLYIKRSTAFNKAYEQLVLHQKLLENPGDVAKITSVKEKRKTPLKAKRRLNVMKASKRKSFDHDDEDDDEEDDDIYAFHDSPFEENDGAKQPKRRHSTNLPSKSNANKGNNAKLKKRFGTKSLDNGNSSDLATITAVNNITFGYEGSEPVTSSTEECFGAHQTCNDSMQTLEQPYSDAVEKMRRKLEAVNDKSELIKTAMDCMQAEIDRLMMEHNESIKRLTESHNKKISETKKKQWCYYCEQDAIYHCCWNTAYCSQTCQQQHWQAEHKKVCRRKR